MKNLLEKIKKTKEMAGIEVDISSPMGYNQQHMKESAMRELATLSAEYREKLMSMSVLLLVTGTESDELLEKVGSDILFKTKLEDIGVRKLLKAFDPEGYVGRSLTIDMALMVTDVLGTVVENSGLNLNGIDLENLPRNITFEKESDFVDTFNELLTKENPSLDISLYFSKVAEISLENEIGEGILPIMASTDSLSVLESVGQDDRFKRVFTITAGDGVMEKTDYKIKDIDEESISAMMGKIKKQLKIKGK